MSNRKSKSSISQLQVTQLGFENKVSSKIINIVSGRSNLNQKS